MQAIISKNAIFAGDKQLTFKIMKLKKLLAVAVLMLMTASIGILRAEIYENTYSAKTNGQAAGALLKRISKQYKADGKIDLTNLDNVINLTALGNVTMNLKGQDDNSEYFKDFTTGLALNSKRLISPNNVLNIAKLLRSLADLDFATIAEAGQNAINNAVTEMYSSTGPKGEDKAAKAISSLPSDSKALAVVSAVSSILDLLDK